MAMYEVVQNPLELVALMRLVSAQPSMLPTYVCMYFMWKADNVRQTNVHLPVTYVRQSVRPAVQLSVQNSKA